MIVFKNPGILDIRAVKTFGMSAKSNDNAIGFFGTGLKYAIAIFLREGFKVKLVTGCQEYLFEKKNIEMREKGFEIITMNGEELSFTTHLGINWKPWQAFRELYCNALDEGGDVFYDDCYADYSKSNETVFMIEGEGDLHLFEQKDSIVLKGDCDHESEGVKVIFKPSNWIYYKGIRVYESQKPFTFTYNITKHLSLTEDRTLSNHAYAVSAITNAVRQSDDLKFIKKIICATPENAESYFTWYISDAGHSFEKVAFKEYEENNDNLSRSVANWVRHKKEQDTYKNIIPVALDESEKEMMRIAKNIVGNHYKISKYEIIFSETLGDNTMAYVQSDQRDKIYISKKCFDKGLLFLASTLLEEVVHQETGYGDLTRDLQTYLFEEMTKLISKKAGVIV